MARRRSSLGRRKIEIRRIESEEARDVCFSKRRAGLFKKASELAILCGAEVASVVFSPANNAYSFGHPSVEAIIERFDPTGLLLAGDGGAGAGGEDTKLLVQLNRRGAELSVQVDAEMSRKERAEAAMAKERAMGSLVAKWLGGDVRDMGQEELMAYMAALDKVKAAIAAPANQELQDGLNHGRAMAATAWARSSYIINQALLAPPPQQLLIANHGCAAMAHSNNNYQVQAPPQQLLLANHGRAMAHASNINYQVQAPPPQQFLLANHGAGFLDQFNAGSANSNAAEIDMQVQQMMMALAVPPPPGFAGAGMEMMILQQGFGGFPGPY